MSKNLGCEPALYYHRQLHGKNLRYPRDILVWLPPSYPSSKRKRYPVLYAQDGQNLMDPSTAFLGRHWKMDEAATSLILQEKLEEIIIVGIYNTPDRNTEYTGGRIGSHYARFVVEEIKPLIDSTYRTKRESENTAVIGSSLGGLISFYFAWWYPEVFSQAACMSASFFWNRKSALREVQNYSGPRKSLRFYLDVGSKERTLIPGYREMTHLLRAKGYRDGVELESYFSEGDDHNEVAWGGRVWRPLLFLFPKSKWRTR